MAKQLSANERKILEDFRAKQAQRTATAVTKSGIDPNERLRLARRRQAEQDKAQRESQSISARQNLQARQQADQTRKNAEIARREAEADRQRIAQQQQQAQQQKQREAQAFADKQRSFLTPNTSLKPTVKQEKLSRDVTKFLADRKHQEQLQQAKQEKQVRNTKRTVFNNKSNVNLATAVKVASNRISNNQPIIPLTNPTIQRQQAVEPTSLELVKPRTDFVATERQVRNNLPVQNFPPAPPRAGDEFRSVFLNPDAGKLISTRTLPDGSIEETKEPAFGVRSGTLGTDARVQPNARPPVSKNFLEGFVAGSQQELVNFGNIADIATGKEGTFGKSRKEVGSSIVDLPFAVGGSLFFNEEGGFDPNLDRAFEKSGEEQEFIGKEFERDPSRAIGSAVTALGVEVALIVGTGGTATVARKGIVKGAQFAVKTRQAKKVADLAKKLTIKGEEKLPTYIEKIGDNKYVIARGTEELKGLGVTVLSPTEAVVTGFTKAGKIAKTPIKLLKGIGKQNRAEAKLLKGKGSGKRTLKDTSRVKSAVGKGQSEIPVTIVDFGAKGRKPSIEFTKRFVPKKGTVQNEQLREAVVTNVQKSDRFLSIAEQQRTGLKLLNVETPLPKQLSKLDKLRGRTEGFSTKQSKVDRLLGRKDPIKKEADDGLDQIRALSGKTKTRSESTTVSGRLTEVGAEELKASEKLGLTKRVATSFQFALEDVAKNPQLFNKIVRTERTLTGRGVQSPKTVKGFEKLQKQGKFPKKQQDTKPFTFSTKAVFETKSTIPKITVVGKKVTGKGSTGKGSTGAKTKPESIFDDVTKTNKGKGGSQTIVKAEAKAQVKSAEKQSLSAVRQDIKSGIKSSTKGGKSKVRQPFDSVVSATSLGARTGLVAGVSSEINPKSKTRNEFGSILITKESNVEIFDPLGKEENNLRSVIPPNIKDKIFEDTKQRTGVVITPKIKTITDTVFDQPQIITTKEPTITTTKTPTTTVAPFGFRPPTFADIRKRDAKRKRSGQGKRLFDVAETPFGQVTVGLGFFIEQKGDETIAESIGVPEPKQPKSKRKKEANPVDAVFGVQDGQFGTTFDF